MSNYVNEIIPDKLITLCGDDGQKQLFHFITKKEKKLSAWV